MPRKLENVNTGHQNLINHKSNPILRQQKREKLGLSQKTDLTQRKVQLELKS